VKTGATRRIAAIGSAALLLLGGCSNVAAQDAAAAAVQFLRAEPAQACTFLAPHTAEVLAAQAGGDCARGLARIDRAAGGEVLAVETAGESAQVRFTDDTVFLAHFPGGWRVTAAGCARAEPDPAVPYECEVEP
jgi:outer membrane murein-binding lipoprotein Lpp